MTTIAPSKVHPATSELRPEETTEIGNALLVGQGQFGSALLAGSNDQYSDQNLSSRLLQEPSISQIKRINTDIPALARMSKDRPMSTTIEEPMVKPARILPIGK